MKNYIIAILLAIFAIPSFGQSISIFDIDTTNFPTMKAKFYAFDKDGKQQRPSASELTITENGINRTITNVSCPSPKLPNALSSVLVIDVSGSMRFGSSSYGVSNMALAKKAATAWVNGLPLGQSESAITTFDGSNYLNQDFTTNKTKLLYAISTFAPQGGTDYNAALINQMSGGLLISNKAKYKKVIILLTDGLAYEPQIYTIISEANKQNCAIFCVTLGMLAPQSLKDIASGTGGQTFENVTTINEAEDVYRKILNISQGEKPCEIEWNSDFACEVKNTTTEITWQGIKASANYVLPTKAVASLNTNPNFISFGQVVPFTQNELTITLTAKKSDFTLTGIKRKFGSSEFTITNTNFPVFIPKNTSKDVNLRFEPSDSSYKYVCFEIITDECSAYFSSSGGFPDIKSNTSTLKLIQPNGGENFIAGSDTLITWDGVSPNDTLQLDFSIDSGKTWQTLTKQATNLKYDWKNIPPPTSKNCLTKLTQFNNKTSDLENMLTMGGHTGNVYDIAYSPDGSRVATASVDGTAKIFDANTGILVKNLIGHKGSVNGIAYSPDGSRVATASDDRTVKIWDVKTGLEIITLSGHTGNVNDLAYSPDGGRIATVSGDITAKIWDANTGLEIRTLYGHSKNLNCIAFSPDGSRIATVADADDKTAKIWDANSGVLIRTLSGHSEDVNGIAYSPDGSKIATASDDGKVKIWDSNSGSELRTISGAYLVYKIAFSPDGSHIANINGDRTTKIWDVNSGALIRTLSGHNNDVNGIAYSPDGSKIATASNDGSAKIWDVNTGVEIRTISGHRSFIYGIAFSPDGSRVATASYDYTAKIWDAKTGAFISVLNENKYYFFGVAYSPDGSRIATASSDKNAKIWDANTGVEIISLIGHTVKVNGIAFSPDGSRIATASFDRTAKIWDAITGKEIKTLIGHNGTVNGIAFSPDGSRIATASSDTTAKIWDANTGLEIISLIGHKGDVNGIAFSPDGSKIGTSSYDTTAKIWDANTGLLIKTLNGHSDKVYGIAYGPDGIRVATASFDRTAKIWDANKGIELKTLKGHTEYVCGIAFSPNGSKIATASVDKTAKIWDIEEKALQQDISDSVFSIVAPSPQSKDIDMKQCVVGASKDSVISTFMINNGNYQYRVDSIAITGANASQFRLVSGTPPFVVPANANRAVEFNFKPTSVGIKTAKLTIYTQADTLFQFIQGEGIAPQLEIVNNLIDFGSLDIGQIKDTIQVVTIKNVGAAALNINNSLHLGPNDIDFTTLSGAAPFSLNAGETAKMNLRFTPKAPGRTSGRLQFEFNGAGSPATVQLFGTGLGGTATINIGSDTAYTNEQVEIPVNILANNKLLSSGVTAISFELEMNKTILFPIGVNSTIDGDNRIIKFDSVPIKNVGVNEVAKLKFIATLGNAEETTIRVRNIIPIGNDADFDVIDGNFKLLGVCKEGGERFLSSALNQTKLLSIAPNPATESIEIEYSNADEGEAEIIISNLLGQTILTQKLEKTQTGKTKLDLSQLPTGQYSILFKTETVLENRVIQVIK